MLAAIGSFMRDGNEVALVATFAAVIGSFLVSYTRAKAEALGLRADVGFGSGTERVVLISIGLGLAPWGLQWPIYVLAAMAWVTVAQRMLFVRCQLRELAEQTAASLDAGRLCVDPRRRRATRSIEQERPGEDRGHDPLDRDSSSTRGSAISLTGSNQSASRLTSPRSSKAFAADTRLIEVC